MGVLADSINEKIAKALKQKDLLRVSTLRLLSSALNYERISKRKDLTDAEEMQVVRREIKKREEAANLYQKGGAYERKKKEEDEIRILKEFLPEDVSDSELASIIEEEVKAIKGEDLTFGKVMAAVMKRVEGRVDGRRVAEMVRKLKF